MTRENPPMRLLRLVLITLLLLGAIVTLVPEEANPLRLDAPVDTIASTGTSEGPN